MTLLRQQIRLLLPRLILHVIRQMIHARRSMGFCAADAREK